MVAIACHGEIDLSTCPTLQEAISRSFTPDLLLLRLDLTGVTFFDSTGVRCLVDCQRRCENVGARLDVVASPIVERVLHLVGLRAILQQSPPTDSGA
jgi:stage II sporulation protein AA (anti-sigma F factor antagonist)